MSVSPIAWADLSVDPPYDDLVLAPSRHLRHEGLLSFRLMPRLHDHQGPSRIEAEISSRYFGPGYSLGNWPLIFECLEYLSRLGPTYYVSDVSYGEVEPYEVTAEWLAGQWELWRSVLEWHDNRDRR